MSKRLSVPLYLRVVNSFSDAAIWQSCPEAVPPKDIGKAYAYLKQRMKQQEEADAALNGMAAKSAPKPAPVKAAPKPAARPAPAKPAARPAPKPQPAPEPEMVAEDDLPF